MSKRVRLATGNEVEIVDRSSPHYGKKGIISDIKHIPVTMIDYASKPLSTHEEITFIVKLDDINLEFNKNQIKKVD
jgi:hypothetical protein